MKVSELRIGNYVYDTLGKVNKIDLEAIIYIVKELHNQVKPIPLTEEWLLKFGFMQYIDFGVKMGTYDKIPLCGFTYSIHTKKVMIMHKNNFNSHWLDVEIKYVHQLQNLFFALTGQELTISNEN